MSRRSSSLDLGIRRLGAAADLRRRLGAHQDSRPVADFFDLADTLLPA